MMVFTAVIPFGLMRIVVGYRADYTRVIARSHYKYPSSIKL